MKALRRLAAAAVAAILATPPASGGMLDLDIYGTAKPSTLGRPGPAWRPSRGYLTKELWLPGSPMNTRGADRLEQSIALTGNAALSGWGVAQDWGGLRHGKEERVAEIGFGLISLWSVFGLLRLWSSPEDDSGK